jgi:RNA polymerase sigma-70 factor (ECF subfamily)
MFTIRQAMAGSPEALGRLVEDCRMYLRLVARNRMSPALLQKSGASDLVQEALIKVVTNLRQFRGDTEEEFLAWLSVIVRSHISNLHRRYCGSIGRETSLEEALGPRLDGRDEPAVTGDSPWDEVDRREEAERVRLLLERLPSRYRQVLLLRHWEDRSFREIAPLMGCSVDAARMLWWRATERLSLVMNAQENAKV